MASKDPIQSYLDGIYTSSDINRVFDELSKPDCFDSYSHAIINEAENAADTGPAASSKYHSEAMRLLMSIEHDHPQQSVPRRPLHKHISVRMVAILMFLIATGTLYILFGNRDSHIQKPTDYLEFVTEAGEIKNLILDDGTAVTLNACSHLKYPANMQLCDIRSVQVDGQAFFKVARDENRPFRVIAGKMNIEVLGTEFDVKAYNDDDASSVKVKTGKVLVELPEASMNLVANQQVLYNHDSDDFSRRSGELEADSWCHGGLLFTNASISDVARELERRFKCHIKLDSGSTFTSRITGSHDGENLSSILQSLYYVADIQFRTDPDGTIVLYCMQ